MIKIQEDIYFSDDINHMDLNLIYSEIRNSYWGNLRTFEEQKKANENSLNFGLFKQGNQIAYSRVMTDKVFFAYLLDVFVVEEEQGKGYSKILLTEILKHKDLINIDKWMLVTKDAHSLYRKFGFKRVQNVEFLMEKLSERVKQILEK